MQKLNKQSSKIEEVLLFNDKYLGEEEDYLLFVINRLADIFAYKVQKQANFDLENLKFNSLILNNYSKMLKISLNFQRIIELSNANLKLTTTNEGLIISASNPLYLNKILLSNNQRTLKEFNQEFKEILKQNVFISKLYQAIAERIYLKYGNDYAILFRVGNYDILNYETKIRALYDTSYEKSYVRTLSYR